MKKLISVLLVFSMLLSVSVLFSSCSRIREKDLEKDAQGVITDAIGRAYASFFDMEPRVTEVAEKALGGGSMRFSLAGKTLLGDAIGKIEMTTYFNAEDRRSVVDALVNYEGEDLTLRTHCDKNSLAFVSEDVFGSGTAYAISFSTLLTDLDNSALLEMMGMSDTDLAELKDALSAMDDMMEGLEKTEEELARIYNEVLETLLPVVGTEDVAVGEKSTACVTVTYTINNDTLKNAATLWIERMVTDAEDRACAISDLEESLAEADGEYEMIIKLYVGKKSRSLVKMTLESETVKSEDWGELDGVSDEDYTERTTQTMELLLSATEISLTGNGKTSAWYLDEDSTTAYAFKLKKSGTANQVAYDFTASLTEDGETVEPMSAKLTYQKQSGDFTFTITVVEDEAEEPTVLTFLGKITVSEKEAVIAINSVTAEDVTIAFQASITYIAEAETPAAPENAKNILTLSEEEVNTFFEDFSQSNLYQIIQDLNS